MLLIIFFSIISLYLLELILFRFGLFRSSQHRASNESEPTVSVIVAARNEEDRIAGCLNSLRNLEYPLEKLEIIVIDDASTDRTGEIIEKFIADHGGLTLLHAPPEKSNLRGKTNAIAYGIRHSHGEILMFTDADCAVSSTWVRKTVQYFTGTTGVVGGFTILDTENTFHGVQALDWLYLFGVASATSGLGIPMTAIGNNLAVRRFAYDEIGGYENIPFSVTEDYSLVHTLVHKNNYSLGFPLDPGATVRSDACTSLLQLVRQKQRWGMGALDMVPVGMLVIILGWFVRVSLLTGAFLLPMGYYLPALLAVILGDYVFLSKLFKLFPSRSLKKYFFLYELYFTLYGIIIPFLAFGSKKVVWKERALRSDKKNAFQNERHS
jgi:cellulose synthase/poly-beta-1,6-N-acetylglucosamine synthase-like glycosyltransferase